MNPPPRRFPARIVRTAAGGTAALVAFLATASPASADPPRPTDYRSEVTGVEPATDAVEPRVVGGDAFLELEVAEGHEVVVPGYGDEPYLRFLPDGTVERNRRSEATYLNDDRQGAVAIPAQADNDAEPEWEEVAGGGAYAWHDHRIHWMGAGTPPGAEPGEVVQSWTVTVEVDGTPTEVRGELVLASEVSPVPWVALGLAAAAAVALVGRRRGFGTAEVATLVAAAGALVVGWGQFSVVPAGAGTEPLLVAVPLAGLAAAVVALVVRRRTVALTAVLAGAAAVVGWGLLRVDVLWTPVLPTELPFAFDRAVTAAALGLAVVAAALAVWGSTTLGASPAAAGGSSATGEAAAPDRAEGAGRPSRLRRRHPPGE